MRCLPIATGRRVAVLISGLILSAAVAVAADDMRTWKDASGKFSIKAKFVSLDDGKVTLEQEDGSEIEIELKKLSPADQKYAEEKVKEMADNPFKTAAKPKDPFKAKAKSKTKAKGGMKADAGEGKTLKVDWSKARAVVAAPAGSEWSVPVGGASEAPAAIKLKPIGLPPKANFFEGTKGLVVSVDGKKAVVGYGWDEPKPLGTTRVVVCDLEKGQTIGSGSTSGLMAPVAISDDGAKVLMRRDEFGFGNADRLELWKVTDSGIEKELSFLPYGDANGGDKDVKWGAFLDAKRIVTVSGNGRLAVFDLATAKPLFYLGIQGGCIPALSPDRKLVAFTTGKEVGVLDVEKGEVVALQGTPNTPFPALAFSPSGKRLALVAMDKLWTYDVATGKQEREMLLTGLHVGGQVFFTGEDFAMVGGRYLLDLENQIKLWDYNGAEKAAAAGSSVVFEANNGTNGPGALIPAQLPHPNAQFVLKKALGDPNLFVLKPGVTVRIDVSGITDGSQRDKVAAALADRLAQNGIKTGPVGALDLVATTEIGKDRDVTYRAFGSFNTRTYKVKEYISRVKFLYQGKPAWETSSYNIPHIAMLKEGQTVESFLRDQEKPNFQFFSQVELPKLLTRPTGAPTLGVSQVSTSGVR